MALNSDACTDVATARKWLRDSAADQTLVETLINGYSRAARLYCRRQFAPTETAVAHVFRYEGGGILDLSPFEATAVTSVVVGTDLADDAEVTLDAQTSTQQAEYRLEPRHGTVDGTFLRMSLPIYRPNPPHHYQVTVTGNWGMAAVPADVALAVLIAVAAGYRNPEAFAARQLGEFGITDTVPPDQAGQSLPEAARNLLRPYRRPRVRG